MNRKNMTRNALVTSIISLLLCVSLLVGTTFAWFTDSETSAGNNIKSGTLNVEMYYANGTLPVPTEADGWADASTGAIFNYDLWEPGYAEVRHIKIANEGTLALKYQLYIVANGEVSDLSDVIDVYFMDPATQVADRAALASVNPIGNLTSILAGMPQSTSGVLAANSEVTVTLALKMQETAGNEYQNLSIGTDFSVVLVATQVTSEDDKFDNQYDADSMYPQVAIGGVTKKEEATAVKTEDESVKIDIPADAPDGNYVLTVSDKSAKTDAEGNTTVSMDISLLKDGVKVSDGNEYQVSVKIGAGLNLTKLMHNEEEITDYTYDMGTGVVTFITDGFSPFSFTYVNGNYVAATKDAGYATLAAAVEGVQDGGTVTLLKDIIFDESSRTHNSGTYYDGLYYVGDKSFTLDLNGKTITNDSSVNDYLLNFKNDGSKANTITIKNGTLDASSSAYCAIATASSNGQKITINLENVDVKGNNSNGAVAKIRGGSELNVKSGTVITGSDSYAGIEAAGSNTVVNIYEGAKIYQNGKTSYCGSLVGASGNATVNVYGGYGKSAKGGFIAMTSGGTINISGGEWIANTDGTYANSNDSVLIAQSEKGKKAIVNVSGGTFKGGYNCYGAAVGDAQINISGGKFNADPATYVANGFEVAENADGTYVVGKIKVAEVNGTKYDTLAEAAESAKANDTITMLTDVTLDDSVTLPAGVTLNGNGKQINGSINAGGDLAIKGHVKVTAFSASYYDRVITIGEGACLEVTGTGRVTLGYGNTFNIYGNIENAKTADKANIQPSLIIPGGISITGGNDATMNVTNAYVSIGSTTSKPGVANGTFTLNFTNSIVEFTKELGFYEPTGGMAPTFKMTVKDSVFTTGTKICIAAPNSEVVIDNSVAKIGTYVRNSGSLTVQNGSVFTAATIQFGENGGNNGTIVVDNSELTITAGSTGHAFDGKDTGKIQIQNGAKVAVDYYKNMTIEADTNSSFTGTEVK